MKLICTLFILLPLFATAQYIPLLVGDSETSTGLKLYFNGDTGSIRAGYAFSERWDPVNSGNRSAAFGDGTMASGDFTFASGYDSEATGNRSFAANSETIASGNNSFACGDETESIGQASFSANRNSQANGDYSAALGRNNIAESFGEFVVGTFATTYDEMNETAFDASDKAFVVGNGTSIANRSNAFTVWKNGRVSIGTDLNPGVDNGVRFAGNGLIENPTAFDFDISADLSSSINGAYDIGNSATSGYWNDVFAINLMTASDMRVKSNVEELSYGIDEVMKMRTIKYTLDIDPFSEMTMGLSAQNLLEIVPEAVKTHDHKLNEKTQNWEKVEMELMGVKYITIIPVLVNAVKDQQAIIDAQNKTIQEQQLEFDAQKMEITEMKRQISSIESMLQN